MNDAAVEDLARRAGIAIEWRDNANKQRRVSADSLRRILAALQLPCAGRVPAPAALRHRFGRLGDAGDW